VGTMLDEKGVLTPRQGLAFPAMGGRFFPCAHSGIDN
jgi:hypothetical protein